MFCKCCVLFNNNKDGNNRVTSLYKLVREPLQKYANILGKNGYFKVHCKNLLGTNMQ